MIRLIGAFAMVFLLASCNGSSKKILIVTRGDLSISGNTISVTEANNYSEMPLVLSGSGKSVLQVSGPTGNFSVEIPGPGYYLLNVRKDTLVGAWQKFGRDLNADRILSQEDLKQKIDSLQKLLTGTNVSAANRNFLIRPNQLQLVTENLQASLIGPFQPIPATLAAGPDGKAPELYKFYTSGEMRDMLANLIKQTEIQPN